MATSKSTILVESLETCNFCTNNPKKYTCPRCNANYCSLECFQSTNHLECSETFYKECVTENLSSINIDSSEQTMLKVLNRIHEQDECCEENSELDSDDDLECLELAERLADIDLDNTTEVWKRLNSDERQAFEAFLRSGDVSKFVTKWQPWWLEQCDTKIIDVSETPNYKRNTPSLNKDIKDFTTLTKQSPNPSVKYNLINILCAYAFTTRYFNGEHLEFMEAAACVVHLSLNLKENQNFNSYESAIISVHQQSIKYDWITVDEENINTTKEDIKLILNGPSQFNKAYYVLCALSDLYNLIDLLLKGKKNPGGNSILHNSQICKLPKAKIKLYLKKIQYLLSYAMYFLNH